MADDWTFGDDDEPEPLRQPLRFVVQDTRTGEKVALDLTAVLRVDAGVTLTSLANHGDTDEAKLLRSLPVLLATLADDDGVRTDWQPVQNDDGKWVGADGELYPSREQALPALAECSSKRKLETAVNESRWFVRIDALVQASKRITEAVSGGRPTQPAASSPNGRGSSGRTSRAGSGSARRR